MAVSQKSIKADVWNIFKDLIKTNVTSVTIHGSGGANTKTVNIQNISQSFPDKLFDSESAYPMITIGSPNFRSNAVTFRSRELDCTLEFNVFATQSETADKIVDKIADTIFDNEEDLSSDGIDEIEIDSTDETNYDRNKINVHARMLVFRFKVVL